MNRRWMVGVLGGLVGMSVIMSVAQAQDPVEVGPDVYKVLFENERVRVCEAHFTPGQSIAMHSHPDHFVYVISPGTLRLTYPDGRTNEVEAKAGEVMWIAAETHAGQNIGSTDVRLLVTELKEPQGGS